MKTVVNDEPADWLRQVLQESARRGHCVRVGCTTCGARPFETLLQAAVAASEGREAEAPPRGRSAFLGSLERSGLLDALVAGLSRLDAVDLSAYRDALQLLACRPSLYVGSDGTITPPLAGTPFGDLVLARVETVRNRALARDRRAMEARKDLEAATARKIAEAEARQATHRQRLTVKAERDAVWRQGQLEAGVTLETPQAVSNRREQRKTRRRAARGSSAKNRV